MILRETVAVRGLIESLLIKGHLLICGYRSGRVDYIPLLDLKKPVSHHPGLGSVRCLCSLKDPNFVILCSETICGIFDLVEGRCDFFLLTDKESFYLAALDPEESFLLLANEDCFWKMFLEDWIPLEIEPTEEFSITSIVFHPNGRECAIAFNYGEGYGSGIRFDDVGSNQSKKYVSFETGHISSFCFNASGTTYAFTSDKVFIYDAEAHQCTHVILEDGTFVPYVGNEQLAEERTLGPLLFLGDDQLIFCDSIGNILHVDLKHKKLLNSVFSHKRGPSKMAVTPNGQFIVSCGVERMLPDGQGSDSWESSIKVWQIDD